MRTCEKSRARGVIAVTFLKGRVVLLKKLLETEPRGALHFCVIRGIDTEKVISSAWGPGGFYHDGDVDIPAIRRSFEAPSENHVQGPALPILPLDGFTVGLVLLLDDVARRLETNRAAFVHERLVASNATSLSPSQGSAELMRTNVIGNWKTELEARKKKMNKKKTQDYLNTKLIDRFKTARRESAPALPPAVGVAAETPAGGPVSRWRSGQQVLEFHAYAPLKNLVVNAEIQAHAILWVELGQPVRTLGHAHGGRHCGVAGPAPGMVCRGRLIFS